MPVPAVISLVTLGVPYAGYFADPDGHVWEVAHHPYWPLDDAGLPRLP